MTSPFGTIAIDTCSDVSTCVTSSLTNVRPCQALELHHLGGVTVLNTCGDVVVEDQTVTMFAVSADNLPVGVVMLLGMPEIVKLDISLDFVISNPDCHLRDAIQSVMPSS